MIIIQILGVGILIVTAFSIYTIFGIRFLEQANQEREDKKKKK
jgi:hypothetical protein